MGPQSWRLSPPGSGEQSQQCGVCVIRRVTPVSPFGGKGRGGTGEGTGRSLVLGEELRTPALSYSRTKE